MDDEVAPVLNVLPAPHELRVAVFVAALVRNANRVLLLLRDDRLILGRGNVLPRVVVRDRHDGLRRRGRTGRASWRAPSATPRGDGRLLKHLVELGFDLLLELGLDAVDFTASAKPQRPYCFAWFTPGTQNVSIVLFFSFASSPR